MAGEIHRITQETLDKLEAEYLELTTVGRTTIARTIESARLMGDLSENGDYHAAKDAQGKMESRIRQLEAMLADVVIVDTTSAATGEVSTGMVVSLQYVGDDDVERYLIGSIEERREGVAVVSPNSPLGQALMGKKAGDRVSYQAPSGPLEVQIVEVGA
jgi:transcription elongation factor GreA